jgi:hypothetical protein
MEKQWQIKSGPSKFDLMLAVWYDVGTYLSLTRPFSRHQFDTR